MTKNEYIVQCPRCGAEFPEREKFCPHCDTPNRKMICRSCGTQINASAHVCPECGARNKKMISVQKIAILSVPFAAVVLAVVLIASKPAKKPGADQEAGAGYNLRIGVGKDGRRRTDRGNGNHTDNG